MNDYLKIRYSEKEKPYTNYPYLLSKYLYYKFNLPYPKEIKYLLDLGCGRGEYLKAFSSLGFKVEGFDKYNFFPYNFGIKITDGDFNKKLPYKNNTFDIVFAKSVIEHTYYPEHIFQECYRILKKEGKLIILTPDVESIKFKFFTDYSHRVPFTLESLL